MHIKADANALIASSPALKVPRNDAPVSKESVAFTWNLSELGPPVGFVAAAAAAVVALVCLRRVRSCLESVWHTLTTRVQYCNTSNAEYILTTWLEGHAYV